MANQPTHASLSLPTTPGRGQELRREDEVYEWAWASQVLLDTGPEGQYYLLGCREPDQDDNTRAPYLVTSPPSLHCLTITVHCDLFGLPESTSSLPSQRGNSSGCSYPSGILSFHVFFFSFRVPARPSASFPVGVWRICDELNPPGPFSASLCMLPTLSDPPVACPRNGWLFLQLKNSILSHEASKTQGKLRQWFIPLRVDSYVAVFQTLWASIRF